MNFINLRNVANQEINESFSGILRISPNERDNIKLDDPTPLLYTIGEKLDLSDSAGNYVGISFVPQVYYTHVQGLPEGVTKINLVNITQEVKDLYCTSELHISPTLYIDLDQEHGKKAPVQIVNKNGVLLFPIEAPIDERYINYRGKMGNKPIKNILDELLATDEIYTSPEYEDYHVKVNGKKIFRMKKPSSNSISDTGDKEISAALVPELYLHDYVLGQSAGHTYKPTADELNGSHEDSRISALPEKIRKEIESDSTSRVTQLSFIEIEKIIWSLLEGAVKGSYRSFDGRYKGLYPKGMFAESEGTENDLYNILFKFEREEVNEEELEDKIRANAPLVGLPVQTGLIMYNAIPPRRFLFHTLRRYENLATDGSQGIDVYLKSHWNLFLKSEDEEIEKRNQEVRNQYITLSNADNGTSFIHNLTTEYALCDGKRIKECVYEEVDTGEIDDDGNPIIESKLVSKTDYPAINKRSSNWEKWTPSDNTENIYDAISASMNSDEHVVRTPKLFEMDQLSLRYLRGLNWLRNIEYERIPTEGAEDSIKEKKYFNQKDMLIEQDGTFNVNEWFREDSEDRPEIVNGSIQYGFEDNTAKWCLPNLVDEETGAPIPNDEGNIVKNINTVGAYYANYDYHLAGKYRHIHQIAVNKNLLKNDDELYKVRDYYYGNAKVYDVTQEIVDNTKSKKERKELQKKLDELKLPWEKYVNLEDGSENYLGSYAMRSIQDITIKNDDRNLIQEIQNLPIAVRGGSTSTMRKVKSGYKGYKTHDPRCSDSYEKKDIFYNTDGGYNLAAYRPSSDKEGWRFLSSLPAGMNKYGSYKDINVLATASFNGRQIPIDDSLPTPPSINLIPLMKI